MKSERKRYHEESADKRQTRFCYTQGPIYFVGQQIVRNMQESGYPAKIHCCYRPAKDQIALVEMGRSKAAPWHSPHQFHLAVDIIHPHLAWNVEQAYWDQLNACAQVISERFGITLEYGYDWGWDMAHIELKEWRKYRDIIRARAVQARRNIEPPGQTDLDTWFKAELPKVWKSKGF